MPSPVAFIKPSPKGPIAVKQQFPRSQLRTSREGDLPFRPECHPSDCHEIRYSPAPLEIDADRATRYRYCDAEHGYG